MIGLGSNRLSVCRRGGMSVTQAGRGGMEWLAGGRMPSWSQWWLPYSRQAGEALKAQFPTQWPTIRDYGFAHPEIVPYVNANPLGWGGYIAYCDALERIEFGSNGMIDTGIVGGSNICTYLDAYVDGNVQWIIAGLGSNSNLRYAVLNGASYTSVRFQYGSYNNTSIMNKLSGRHTFEINLGKFLVDGVLKAQATNTFTSDGVIRIGTHSTEGDASINYMYGCKIWNGATNTPLRELLPCKLKSNNQLGAWDLVGAEFIPTT